MKSFFSFFLINSFLILTTFSYHLQHNKVTLAINCGSSQDVTGADGIYYKSDRGCKTGKTSNYQESRELANAQIKYTEDKQVYMTERHDDQDFIYQVPLIEAGSYVLILKFSELYFRESNKRQFNIKFGAKVVVSSLDIVKKVGPITAYDEYIPFEYDALTRQVTFKNEIATGATDIAGNLQVVFEQIPGRDNPMVQGIVLFKGKLFFFVAISKFFQT